MAAEPSQSGYWPSDTGPSALRVKDEVATAVAEAIQRRAKGIRMWGVFKLFSLIARRESALLRAARERVLKAKQVRPGRNLTYSRPVLGCFEFAAVQAGFRIRLLIPTQEGRKSKSGLLVLDFLAEGVRRIAELVVFKLVETVEGMCKR